jgi:hypothetical protein
MVWAMNVMFGKPRSSLSPPTRQNYADSIENSSLTGIIGTNEHSCVAEFYVQVPN